MSLTSREKKNYLQFWTGSGNLEIGDEHRYRKSQNRLLKVCCVPATTASLRRVSLFFFFVAVANYSTNKANKAGGTCR